MKRDASDKPVRTAQVAALQKASSLAQLAEPSSVAVRDGVATLKMRLPRQAVSLLVLSYCGRAAPSAPFRYTAASHHQPENA